MPLIAEVAQFELPAKAWKLWTISELDRLVRLCEERGNRRTTYSLFFARSILSEFPGRTVSGIQKALYNLKRRTVSGVKPPKLALAPTEASYLAAMIEAEGSIIYKSKWGSRIVLITNTDPALIAYVKKLVPFAKIHWCDGNKRSTQSVNVSHRLEIVEVIRWCLPYMRGAKRAKAELLLERFVG